MEYVTRLDAISEQQILSILHLQDQLNKVIQKEWLDAGNSYLRAVIAEVGEAIDHYGWKWWKKQTRDIEQVQIELIDILHFYLSYSLVKENGLYSNAASAIIKELGRGKEIEFDGKSLVISDLDVLGLLELLAGLAASGRASFAVLQECMRKCDLSWKEAFEKYVAKNVLNLFRQAHGYNKGSYIKIWNGMEDNARLSAIMKEIDLNQAGLNEIIWSELESEYSKVVK